MRWTCRQKAPAARIVLPNVVKYDNIASIIPTRIISWVKGALRDFQRFPTDVQRDMLTALTMAARGGKADTAKPFKGAGRGVFEIALRHRGDAFRVIYAIQIGEVLWVVHAFQKKSKSGIKTPLMEVELIHERLKRLKEALK